MLKRGKSHREIGRALGRSEAAIMNRAYFWNGRKAERTQRAVDDREVPGQHLSDKGSTESPGSGRERGSSA